MNSMAEKIAINCMTAGHITGTPEGQMEIYQTNPFCCICEYSYNKTNDLTNSPELSI
jgi:hypothetical protein